MPVLGHSDPDVMVFLWTIPDEYPQELIGKYLRDRSPDRFLFRKGEELPMPVGVPQFEFDAPLTDLRSFDVLPNSTQIPLVASNVAGLLLALCAGDIQLIEADVVARGQKLEGFKLVNVTHLVSCIDHNGSDYSFIPAT